MKYPHEDVEKKWQARWEKSGANAARDLPLAEKAKKFYGLIEFPYPSGEGLHVGHPRSYVALDIITRKKRLEGRDVLYPIGWDAFGLPTENFAIKHKIKPAEATKKNVANFTRQLKMLGLGFDWSREINTSDPVYYKWTQWMFLKFFGSWYDAAAGRARPVSELPIPKETVAAGEAAVRAFVDGERLAFKTETEINWCPKCKIGLANEEAVGGVCERCGTLVEKRRKKQWMIRITKYADRLIKDLDGVDYLEKIKTQQINWIGRSEGAYVDFALAAGGRKDKITVFTTRPDTLYGATYLVLTPEHPLVAEWLASGAIENATEVEKYRVAARAKTEIERQENRDKTGVELEGIMATNPANGEKIPVWIADYVLAGYGTGAIMAVPAHDERDFEFAKKFGLSVVPVVVPTSGSTSLENVTTEQIVQEEIDKIISGIPFVGDGYCINSGFLDGLPTWKAKDDIISWLEEKGSGRRAVTYKLRDWVFSRQRYWGEPIPIVICPQCGYVPLAEAELPLTLPEVEHYEPTETGESPLAAIHGWVDVKCPKCGGSAERETDTMPNWAGSSWYFLRYCDPKNDRAFADPAKLKFWLPVDLYNGGMEHTTLHLLYSRFWYKFLWDLGLVPAECGSEPYAKRRSHALILGGGGVKMSKSKGNVVNPDLVVAEFGADVFRLYEMFIGPFDQDAPWDTQGIVGVRRFVERVYGLAREAEEQGATAANEALARLLHKTIKKVGEDIEAMRFNTAVSALMIMSTALVEAGPNLEIFGEFLKLLAPFAPHLAEECWETLGHKKTIFAEAWPTYDAKFITDAEATLAVQVNGKLRGTITVATDAAEAEAVAAARGSDNVQKWLADKTIKKIVYVPGRLLNFVVE